MLEEFVDPMDFDNFYKSKSLNKAYTDIEKIFTHIPIL